MLDKLLITSEADRLTVAAILIKNGYTIRTGKVKRTNGKSYDYFVYIVESPIDAQKEGVQ